MPVGGPTRRSSTSRGRYLAPGFVTVHTHLSIVFPFVRDRRGRGPGPHGVPFGGAGPRSARGRGDDGAVRARAAPVDVTLREADRRGWFVAPRYPRRRARALGARAATARGRARSTAAGRREFEAAARAELEAGADHVKIFITGGLAHEGERPEDPEMSDEEMRAVVRAADDHGTYVVAHAGHHEAIRRALDAGVRSFEHAYVVDDATAALLARTRRLRLPDPGGHPVAGLDGRAHGFEAHSRENARRASVDHLASARRLVAAGVALTNGTDIPPGDVTEGTTAVVREAELLVGGGPDPGPGARRPTMVPARMCGVDTETGCIAAGLAADLSCSTPTRRPISGRCARCGRCSRKGGSSATTSASSPSPTDRSAP